jgi:hypothetical protein
VNPRLGLILMFTGDKRKVNASIAKVTTFSAVSDVLKQGDSDVTATYISDQPTSAGNVLISATIGGNAALPPGNYRYYITGTYGGKARTWYWDVIVLAKDLSQLGEIPLEDYDPFIEEFVLYEGDNKNIILTIPGLDFSDGSGVFNFDSAPVTSTYCNSSVSASGETLTTHNIGGQASIPAGDYGYFVSGTYNNSEAIATWFFRVKVIAKQSII